MQLGDGVGVSVGVTDGDGVADGDGFFVGLGEVEGDVVVVGVADGEGLAGGTAPPGVLISPVRNAMARVTASSSTCLASAPRYWRASKPHVAP
jgi:hypothetical protein